MSGNPPNDEPWVPKSEDDWRKVFAGGTLDALKQYDTERAEWEAKTKGGGTDDKPTDEPPKRKSLAERLMG
jgi:hypothetical protein